MERHDELSDALSVLTERFGSLGNGFGRVLAAWAEAVGPQLARLATPTSLRAGVLRVRCDDGMWATELLHQAPAIVARINAQLSPARTSEQRPPPGRVIQLRPYVGRVQPSGASRAPGTSRPEDIPQRALTGEELAAVAATVGGLPAGELRDQVERAITASLVARSTSS